MLAALWCHLTYNSREAWHTLYAMDHFTDRRKHDAIIVYRGALWAI